MVKASALVAVSLALLSACHRGPDIRSASQCPAWRNIDLASLPTHLNNDPDDGRWEDIRSEWANETHSIPWATRAPTASVRFTAFPGGLTTDPTVREVVGRQSADGWEIHARSGTAPGWQEQQWTDWRAVRLSPRGNRRLTALLADPCLWLAPRFLDSEVRLSNGRGDARPDGPTTAYDLTQGNRRWGGWHFSWSVGPPGQLRSLLLSEAFGLPEWVEDDIGPEGWFDWPPSSS
ncbi:hypothetical protein KKHFBJBL_01356 [Brevundimonas sp. NIBR11]|nr:hypothetical protein KKHFBJBL_01356 [Brevundimonas sp. NIBR11]